MFTLVLFQKLLLLLFGEVVQQGVFVLLPIEKGVDKNISAAVGVGKVVQKLREDLIHAAAVFGFQNIRADDEIVSQNGLRAHIGSAVILHIVHGRCSAHTDGA